MSGDTDLDPDVVKEGTKTLNSLFISGDCPLSTVFGPDCAGIGSVKCLYAGGKLVICVDVAELLDFYQWLGYRTRHAVAFAIAVVHV